jgi:hypothetical protein
MADDLKMLAVGRLFLDTHAHVKSHWIMVSPAVSQVALHFGVNDLEGTVVREKIYHAVGAKTSQAMSLDEILRLVRGAGKVPAERDSFYRVLRTFDDPERRPAAGRLAGRPDVAAGAGPGRRRRRCASGRIPYINCFPGVRRRRPRASSARRGARRRACPTALNRAWPRAARRQRGLRRRVRARRRPLLLLPTSPSRATGRCAACCCSATRRPRRSGGRDVVVSTSSMTSVALLELLFDGVWRARPRFVPATRRSPTSRASSAAGPGGAAGAARHRRRGAPPQGRPAGRRPRGARALPVRVRPGRRVEAVDRPAVRVRRVGRAARDARRRVTRGTRLAHRIAGLGCGPRRELAAQAQAATGVPRSVCAEYFAGLDYRLGPAHLAGLTEFFNRLVRAGRVPDARLAFLPAA